MNPSKAIRIGIAAAFVLAWLLLRLIRPQWAMALFLPWMEMRRDFGWWVPAVGGTLLVATLASFLWTLYGPRRHRADDAMALGCVSMASFGVGGIILILLLAVILQWHGISNMISFTMMILALFILPQYYWEKSKDWRKARQWQEKGIPPKQLSAFLGGKTHVIDRENRDTGRHWRELRFYARDGAVRGYEQVDDKITACPARLVWRIGKSGLEIQDTDKNKVFKYTITRRGDGSAGYYFDEEASALNGQLAFRTVEIRQGEPQP